MYTFARSDGCQLDGEGDLRSGRQNVDDTGRRRGVSEFSEQQQQTSPVGQLDPRARRRDHTHRLQQLCSLAASRLRLLSVPRETAGRQASPRSPKGKFDFEVTSVWSVTPVKVKWKV